MIYLELFFSFVKIGFTSFGGLSMIPLILDEMQKHQWMSVEDLTNLVAIAEMTPGPIGINCATFAGTQTAGVLGGLVAVAGVLTPAFTFALLVAVFFTKFRDSDTMKNIMSVIKPICIAMIVDVVFTLGKENYFPELKIDFAALGIGLLMFYLIIKKKWAVPKVIGCSALLGILIYGIL